MFGVNVGIPPLELTLHLKIDGWKTILSFRDPAYFQVQTVSFWGYTLSIYHTWYGKHFPDHRRAGSVQSLDYQSTA